MKTDGPLPIGKIESNSIRAFFTTFISFGIPALILIGALYVANVFVDFNVVLESLAIIGLGNVDEASAFNFAYVTIIAIVFVIAFVNTLMSALRDIVIFPDKVVITGWGRADIFLGDIVKINYDKKGLQHWFGCGSVKLEITGGLHDEIVIDYVCKPQEKVVLLQSAVANFNFKVQERQHLMMENNSQL